MEDITHQQRQAFKRIELIAQWEGRLNTNHLTESLGITRQSASKLINEYKAFCPHNLAYNNQQKCYEPTAEFSPHISSGLLDDYIAISPTVAGAHLSDIPTHACLLRLGSGHNRSEEHTSELQSRENLVCRLLLEKKKKTSE